MDKKREVSLLKQEKTFRNAPAPQNIAMKSNMTNLCGLMLWPIAWQCLKTAEVSRGWYFFDPGTKGSGSLINVCDENNTITHRVKETIAIKEKGNPPWIGMCAWTYHQFTILSWKFETFLLCNLSPHNAEEVWVIQIKYLFCFLIFLLYSTCKYGKVFLISLLLMLNSAKQNIITFYNNFQPTFEQPGVKAPGTANRTPFLPANNSAMLTLPFGVPSMTWTDGSLSPTCHIIDDFLFSTNLTYICFLPSCLENY